MHSRESFPGWPVCKRSSELPPGFDPSILSATDENACLPGKAVDQFSQPLLRIPDYRYPVTYEDCVERQSEQQIRYFSWLKCDGGLPRNDGDRAERIAPTAGV